MIRTGVCLAALTLAASLYAKEIPADTGVPVSVLVTVKGHPNLQAADLLVSQNKQPRPITQWEPLRGAGNLQLWILIDDGSQSDIGVQLADLRRFILAQPAATRIGVGYMRNGSVQQAQPLTADHQMAAKALRLPTGPAGISASPYLALSELIHKWPAGDGAHEVLMVTSGIDPNYGTGPANPYLDTAIHDAQRAGVAVYSIYYPAAGVAGHLSREVFWGQNYLAQLSEDTGGTLYWLGWEKPVALAPYLDDLGLRLDGQYVLTFLARPERRNGFQNVEVRSELPHVKVTAPSQVYVPAEK